MAHPDAALFNHSSTSFSLLYSGKKKEQRLHPHSAVSSKHILFQFPNSILSIVVKFSRAFILVDSFPLKKKIQQKFNSIYERYSRIQQL